MEEHRLEIVKGHLLVHLDARLALIDTGSPRTLVAAVP
jgi:hypothetical protein